MQIYYVIPKAAWQLTHAMTYASSMDKLICANVGEQALEIISQALFYYFA